MAGVGELRAANDRAARAEVRSAELALALEVLDRLTGVASEAAVATAVLDLAHLLLGAGRARLIVLDRRGRPARWWERVGAESVIEHTNLDDAADGAADETAGAADSLGVSSDGTEVVVPIIGRSGPLARLVVGEFAVTGATDRYDDTLRTMARMAAMALASVRAMHGIVPICLECKRIRDERGEWHRLEEWIALHSEAMLSHGLCPTCLGGAIRDLDASGPDPSGPDPSGGAPAGA